MQGPSPKQFIHGAWSSFVGVLALSGGGVALTGQAPQPGPWPSCPGRPLGESVPLRSEGAAANSTSRPLPCPNEPTSNAHRRWSRLQMQGQELTDALRQIDENRCVDESLLMATWAARRAETEEARRIGDDGKIEVRGGDTMLAFDSYASESERAVSLARDTTTGAIWQRRRIAYAATVDRELGEKSTREASFLRWAGSPPMSQRAIVLAEHVAASWAPVAVHTYRHAPIAEAGGQPGAGQGLRLWGMEGPLVHTSLSLAQYYHQPTEKAGQDFLEEALQQVAGSQRLMLPLWQTIFRTPANDSAGLLRAFGSIDESLRRAGVPYFAQELALRACEVDYDAAAAIRCLFTRSCHGANWRRRLATLKADPRTRAWARHIAHVAHRHPTIPLLVVADVAQIIDLRATFEQSGLALWNRSPTGSLAQWGMTNGGTSAECHGLLAEL